MADQTEGFDPLAVPIRPAATVMLIRDGHERDDGDGRLEVFMLRRNMAAVFAGGMYAFPGGAVDDADRTPEAAALCDGRTDAEASRLLRMETGGLAWWIAAIRECFEEVGFLLATKDGKTVALDDPKHVERFRAARREIHAGTLPLRQLCEEESLRLDLTEVQLVANWITPPGSPRRFDTRFFVAHAPEEQTPIHDGNESIESLWIRPADALDQHAAGNYGMFPPTVAVLVWLAQHHTSDEAMRAAAKVGVPPRIGPDEQFDSDGEMIRVRWRDQMI